MWRIGGSCALPLGALATVDGARIEMLAVVISPDGSRVARVEVVSDTPEGAAALATKELIAEGAEEILEALDDERMRPLAGRTVLVTRPAADVPLLANNQSFRAIDIDPGTLTSGTVNIALIGTATSANLQYVFPGNFTVQTGAADQLRAQRPHRDRGRSVDHGQREPELRYGRHGDVHYRLV